MSSLLKPHKPNLLSSYKNAKGLIENIPPLRKRRKRYYFFAIIRVISTVIVLAFLALVVFTIINFLNFKVVYQNVLNGKDNLEYSAGLIKEKKYQSAADYAEMSEQNFQSAISRLNIYYGNYFINHIPVFNRQVNDLVYLLSTAEILSRAVKQGAQFGSGFENIVNNKGATFSNLSREEKRQFLKKIYESAPELNGIKANIELALLNLDNVNLTGILWPLQGKIKDLNKQLLDFKYLFDIAIPATQIMPAILGYPEKSSFLVLLQNRDELRPTGGFIGTYAILEIENSDITRLDTHDIYHMDMPVKDKLNVKPPDPLAKYLSTDKWFMRDANWSPDWPIAASKIEWFFKAEDKLLPPKDKINKFSGDFDGVIGITIQLIIDLLDLTGPVTIDGIEYNSSNFDKLLEYRVEKGYENLGVPSWQRKEVIGEIAKVLKQRVMDMPLLDILAVVKIIDKNLNQKNILIYLKDPAIQEVARDQNWAGEIKNKRDDYIMIVDANLASFKTDAVINRKIEYKMSQDINGMFADLNINYAHNGGFDWRTTRYRTYTRVYVPLGSTLIKAEGYMDEPVKSANELGKTVFSGFTVIEPGKIGNLHIYYKLPDDLNQKAKLGNYSLYFQKQPGSAVESVSIDLGFLNDIRSYEPTGFYINRYNNNLNWETDLATDRELTLKLK